MFLIFLDQQKLAFCRFESFLSQAQLQTREQHCSSLQQSNMSNWKKYGSYLTIHALMYSSTMKSIVVKTIWNFNLLDPAIHFEIYASDIVWFLRIHIFFLHLPKLTIIQ